MIALGLGFVLSSRPFQAGFGVLGGIILIISGIVGISKLKQKSNQKNIIVTKYHPILGGVLFSTILNPTVILWWATVEVATIMEALVVASILGVALWLLGHFLSDFFWYSLISLSVAKGKKALGLGGYRALLIFCTTVLLVLGTYFTVKYGLLF
jgi:threonine/homoserine/homoserine lactone efflux protein